MTKTMKAKRGKPAKAKAKSKKVAKPETRDWTLMVYLCGDNNLSSAGTVDDPAEQRATERTATSRSG